MSAGDIIILLEINMRKHSEMELQKIYLILRNTFKMISEFGYNDNEGLTIRYTLDGKKVGKNSESISFYPENFTDLSINPDLSNIGDEDIRNVSEICKVIRDYPNDLSSLYIQFYNDNNELLILKFYLSDDISKTIPAAEINKLLTKVDGFSNDEEHELKYVFFIYSGILRKDKIKALKNSALPGSNKNHKFNIFNVNNLITLPNYHYRTPEYTYVDDKKKYMQDLKINDIKQLPRMFMKDIYCQTNPVKNRAIYREYYKMADIDDINFARATY